MKTSEAVNPQKTRPEKMDPVVHFEMPVDNRTRAMDFYSSVFGWKMNPLGEENDSYILAGTSDSEPSGLPRKPGMINGGFFTRSPDRPAQYPSVVIAVDDIRASMKKIKAAGGEVLGEPMEIPGFGWYVSFYDTEKNRVSIMEPSAEMEEKSKRMRS